MTRLYIISFFVLFVVSRQVVATGNVVCYYINSNGYLLAPPENLDPNLCTHINYAFVELDTNGNLQFQNEKLDIGVGMYRRVVNLKLKNSKLKVLLSVGGVAARVFSNVAADSKKRQNFVKSAKDFLQKYSFDGFDIDWEKPLEKDRENFISLLSELRKEFDLHGFLLTVAVWANPSIGYDAPGIAKYADMVHVMCYNFYGSWSAYTGQNSALFEASIESNYEKNNLNIAANARNWITAGIPHEKLHIGLAFYGRSFTLINARDNKLHAPTTGGGRPLTPTFADICKKYKGWKRVWDDEQKNPYKYLGNQWVGYDDEQSINEKVEYIVSQKFGGAMVWHIGGDDIDGKCGEKQLLLKVVHRGMSGVNSKHKFKCHAT